MEDFPVEPAQLDEAPEQEIPEVDPLEAIIRGDVPAASIPPGSNDPMTKRLAAGFQDAAESGAVDFFDSQAGDTVVFNPEKVTRQSLQEAEQNGSLLDLAPPLQSIFSPEAPQTPAGAPQGLDIPVAAPMTGPKAPAKLVSARKANLKPTTPSGRPIPGGGQTLNDLEIRAV